MRRVAAEALYLLSFYRDKNMTSVLDMSNSAVLFASQASEAAFLSHLITTAGSIPTASQAMSPAYKTAMTPQLHST